jgi:hypothetical protein
LSMYWVMRARHDEGRLLMEQTLEHGGDELPAQMRARALFGLAVCLYGSGDDEPLMVVAEEGATLFRRAGDRHGEARAGDDGLGRAATGRSRPSEPSL